ASHGGEMVLARLPEISGGAQLLRVVAGRQDAELIGGATRDLLLARTPKELDVVVESGAELLAQELAAALADAGASSDAGLQRGAASPIRRPEACPMCAPAAPTMTFGAGTSPSTLSPLASPVPAEPSSAR